MNIKVNLGSYLSDCYNEGPKRVQLISNHRICTMEEVDKYFGDVLDEYNNQEAKNSIKTSILNIKDKLCQIMKKR